MLDINDYSSDLNMFKSGDILRGYNSNKKAAYHPIIFVNKTDEIIRKNNRFLGGMITHSCINGNVKFIKEHFNNNLELKYNNSSFVPRLFFKLEEWGPFRKVGELTEQGLLYFLEHIENIENPETFANYYKRNISMNFNKVKY